MYNCCQVRSAVSEYNSIIRTTARNTVSETMAFDLSREERLYILRRHLPNGANTTYKALFLPILLAPTQRRSKRGKSLGTRLAPTLQDNRTFSRLTCRGGGACWRMHHAIEHNFSYKQRETI
jgi:hypothetical protein